MRLFHLLILITLFGSTLSCYAEVSVSQDSAATGLQQVDFRLKAPDAQTVHLAGSFNGWSATAHQMQELGKGDFATTLPLSRGAHQYKFVVNGSEWRPDPDNPNREEDGLGGENSVLEVGTTTGAGGTASGVFIPPSGGPSIEPLGGGKSRVTFSYHAPQTERVFLAGSFNHWAPAKDLMMRIGDSHTTTILLEDGEHQYKFVINGSEWKQDPTNREASDDGNQGHNSVLRLGPTAHIQNSEEQPGDGKLLAEALFHDPHSIAFLNPLPTGETIVKLRAMANDTTSARVRVGNTSIPMKSEYADKRLEYFRAKLPVSGKTTVPRSVSYSFATSDAPAIALLGSDGVTTQPDASTKPFSRTIEASGIFATPEWAKKVVWYEVFPERFRNGNPTNDPKTTAGIRAWTSDWYKPGPDEHNAAFEPGVYQRRYGGDFQGVIEKLPYLKELGVGAIWFNPVFEAESLHKYDATDFRHIDHNLGAGGDDYARTVAQEDLLDPGTWIWSESDKLFLELIKQAHAAGIRVIIDGVFNHTGTDHPAFQDVKKRGEDSPYKDWYQVTRMDPFEYEGWAGFGGLPVFKEDENGFASPSLREHIKAVTRRWLDPNGDGDPSDGIDGWRLDVPNEVNSEWWREWRDLVKSINPDALIMGEIWDPPAKWLQGDQFDSVMNYQMAKALHRFFVNKGEATRLQQDFALLLHQVPDQANYVMMNLMDSHDTDRLVSQLNNPNREYDARNRQQDLQPGEYSSAKPSTEVYKRMKQFVGVKFFYVGSPMIYYGDEVGMWGADDPEDRKPMLWKDLEPYEKPDENFVMEDVLTHFRRCAAIRNTLPALQTGDYEALLADDDTRVFAFRRFDQNQEVVVVTNDSPNTQQVAIPLATNGETRPMAEFVDLLNDPNVRLVQGKHEDVPTATQLRVRFSASAQRFIADDTFEVSIAPHTTSIFQRVEQGK